MWRLTGAQFDALRNALLEAFPDRAKLAHLVRVSLDLPLDRIDATGNLEAAAYNVIRRAETDDSLASLIKWAQEQNPGNPALIAFVEQWQKSDDRGIAVDDADRRRPDGFLACPPLPASFVERPTELNRIRDAVLSQSLASHQPIAIFGMAGTGKTTLLNALCQDAAIRQTYPDGVAWISVGREILDIRPKMIEAALTLGANASDFERLEQVPGSFRRFQAHRAVLVALDDVWDAEYVRPFLLRGDRSRVVLTTRDRNVAIILEADEVEVTTLAAEQAVQLLREWARRDDPAFVAVAEKLGFHPLALKLAGAQLRDQLDADQWLQRFHSLSQLKLGRVASSREDNLQVSFEQSLKRLPEADRLRYFSLGIFPDDIPVPSEVIRRLWRQLDRGFDQTDELLIDLERLALVDMTGATVNLHDLLRFYTREQLGSALPKTHEALLAAYGASPSRRRPQDTDDYYRRFATYHFRGAGWPEPRATKFDERDYFGWIKFLFTITSKKHALLRPSSTVPEALPTHARISIIGNFGTGMYGAPVIAQSLAMSGPYDMILHLGGIFYFGKPDEVRERFLDIWPHEAARISRALNGNHEMYSGGTGYFDHVLRDFNQSASYFALANDHWLLVALDTAYIDNRIDPEQATWLHSVLEGAGNRRVVIFSHHHPFCRLLPGGATIRAPLEEWLRIGKIDRWYWGHAMQCVVYDPHPQYKVRGRCVGNGGMPIRRPPEVIAAATEDAVFEVMWKRLPATPSTPSCLVLDGPNRYVAAKPAAYSPHGYMTLEFSGANVVERVHLADGPVIWRSTD